MEKVQRILDIICALSNTMRARDRSVKVIQYGSQMLVGFYASKFTAETITALKATRRSASTSRKAFWLLKSFNHISIITKTISAYNLADGKNFAIGFDLIEQFALVVYFWYENLVFLARHNLVSFGEECLDFPCNASWFVGDAACFCSTTIRFYTKLRELIQAHLELQRYSKRRNTMKVERDDRFHLQSSSQHVVQLHSATVVSKEEYSGGSGSRNTFNNVVYNENNEKDDQVDDAALVQRLNRKLKEKTEALTGDLLPMSIVSSPSFLSSLLMVLH